MVSNFEEYLGWTRDEDPEGREWDEEEGEVGEGEALEDLLDENVE